ncbi:MAG: cardiolipin synthase [Halieaceae bacterium]|jgi:cardiolipin synthase|nr:cardiolipin synthase [Halieaceae bacterium]
MDAQLLTTLIAVALVLVYVIAIVSALEAILNARTSQGAVAWAISLLTLPYVTVPLYLVFGRNKFDGYLEQRDEIERESLRLIRRTSGMIEQHIVPVTSDTPLYASLYNLARMPATSGNRVELLIDGQQTFDSIMAGLQSAQKYIFFQFYIIRDDKLGRRLCRALADRARAGVKVFLLYDEIGSRKFAGTRLCSQLQMTGVKVAPFNTTQGRRNRFQLNFRNHRKNVVVDGKYAWIGGHNVGDEYLGLKRRYGQWRDTHTRVAGPAVLGAMLAFATDWHWATRSPMNVDWEFPDVQQGDSTVLVFPSDPASEYDEAGLMYHQAIAAATRRIWIASPYFVPDHGIVSALQLAALRGVDVRVLIPDEPDGPVVAMANWSYTRDLLPTGVKVYRYQGGFMHQKVLLMDDRIAGVGTANFDNRSFRLNFELTLLVDDPAFATQVDEMLQADMRRSRQVSLQEMDNKPVWFPLAMGIARLFSPVL